MNESLLLDFAVSFHLLATALYELFRTCTAIVVVVWFWSRHFFLAFRFLNDFLLHTDCFVVTSVPSTQPRPSRQLAHSLRVRT